MPTPLFASGKSPAVAAMSAPPTAPCTSSGAHNATQHRCGFAAAPSGGLGKLSLLPHETLLERVLPALLDPRADDPTADLRAFAQTSRVARKAGVAAAEGILHRHARSLAAGTTAPAPVYPDAEVGGPAHLAPAAERFLRQLQPISCLETAAALAQAGRLGEALTYVDDQLGARPEQPDLLELRARLLARLSHHAEAGAVLRRVAQLDADAAWAQTEVPARGAAAQHERVLLLQAQLSPRDPTVYAELARLYEASGHAPQAAHAARVALAGRPQLLGMHALLARRDFAHGWLDGAIDHLRGELRLLVQQHADTRPLDDLLLELAQAELTDAQATSLCEAAEWLRPTRHDDVDFWWTFAVLQLSCGRLEEAMVASRRGNALAPDGVWSLIAFDCLRRMPLPRRARYLMRTALSDAAEVGTLIGHQLSWWLGMRRKSH